MEVEANYPDVDRMTEEFHCILDRFISSCFSWKRVRRKSNDAPWLSDHLRSLIKRRIAIFRSEGRSTRWKRLDKSIRASIESRKAVYFDKETEKLKAAGRNASWYSILSRVIDDDAPQIWSLSDLEPNKAPADLAEELAEHFTNNTNEA